MKNNQTESKSNKKRPLRSEELKSNTDPQGSYTGVPENAFEVPVQDADDL